MRERLQKYMAEAGLGSRRRCETLIKAGRVKVNGLPAELGMSIDPQLDSVTFEGRLISGKEQLVYLALNKPAGVVTSRKSQGGRRTIMDLVDVAERVYPVGRLDADSQGLVLLTNDGDLTYELTHPKFEHEKEYRLLLDRLPAEGDLAAWRRGLHVPGLGDTSPAEVDLEPAQRQPWVRVVMHEGKKRQIRRVAEYLGFTVVRLIRVRIGGLSLGDLEEGRWRRLTSAEVAKLRGSGRRANEGERLTSPTGP